MTRNNIDVEQLVSIVSAAQTRTKTEDVDLLLERGNNIDWLFGALDTDPKKGISAKPDSLQQRKIKYGSNQKYERPMSTFCQLFVEALDDFVMKILIAASIFSIVIEVGTADADHRAQAWIQGFVVLVAVGICALVTAVNNYSKQRQFKQLNSVADERKKVTLRRDGELIELHQDFILVGDIINLAEGMEIPADAILIDANQVTTDQSAMTGEADPVPKNTLQYCQKKKTQLQCGQTEDIHNSHDVPSPILLSGTKVLTGQGRIMVLVVGEQSCIGKIRALLTQEEEQVTPLQAKLQEVAEDIGKFGLFSAIAILTVLLVRFTIEKAIQGKWDNSTDLKELISFFILAITVVVVAIPEGLPLSVTLSLAVSVKKMLNDNNLVRKMQACETMGGADNICSDKTGTLTMNKMTLTQFWNDDVVTIDTSKDKLNFLDLNSTIRWGQYFKIGSLVNSTAHLKPQEKGSSTEIALLKYFEKMNVLYLDYRQKYPTSQKYPFSSARKRMSIILPIDNHDYIFVKGASEMVLEGCRSWHNMKNDAIQPITHTVKTKMEEAIVKMAQSSLRTLCLAYKKINKDADKEKKDEKGVFEIQKDELILICIVGVRDIPRYEVPGAIAQCHKAGIKVRMVTGDNIITAKAIAKDVGIIKQGDDSIIMEGTQFTKLIGGVICKKCRTKVCGCARDAKQAEEEGKDLRIDTIQNGEEFDKLKDKLLVLARSRPEDKYALVTGLKERGSIVAVTGDGTNDAPALKKADVGFAMGLTGTEVAREAASIILLDDNFNSIVKAVLWGRNIYESIRKFIQFQLTINIVAVSITLVGAALLKQQVLAPIQMLWINLIMDTLASLALATEPPSPELLDRKPTKRDEHIVSKTMFKHIIAQAIFQFLVLLILIFAGDQFIPQYEDAYDSGVFVNHPEWKWNGNTVRSGRLIYLNGESDYQTIFKETKIYSRHFTFIFNTFVMMQIFNFINCRKIHDEINSLQGITKNPLFMIIVAGIFFLQILLITFTGNAFKVYSNFGLFPQQWLICIAIGLLAFPLNFFVKFIKISQPQHPVEIPVQVPINRSVKKISIKKNTYEEPTGDTMLHSISNVVKIKKIINFPQAKFHPMNTVESSRVEVTGQEFIR